MSAARQWEVEEIEFLREFYPTTCTGKIADALERNRAGVKTYANKIGLRKNIGCHGKKNWADADLALLKMLFPYSHNKALVKILNASENAIVKQAAMLGLVKSDSYMEYYREKTARNLDSGMNTRFEKGLVPWLKGKKGVTGANCGSFRKERVPLKGVYDNSVCDTAIVKKYLQVHDPEKVDLYVKKHQPLIAATRLMVRLKGKINKLKKQHNGSKNKRTAGA